MVNLFKGSITPKVWEPPIQTIEVGKRCNSLSFGHELYLQNQDEITMSFFIDYIF